MGNEKNGQIAVTEPQTPLTALTREGQLQKYLYTFRQHGKEVVDVTNDGINRLAMAAGVSIETVTILSEDEQAITVQAVAVNADGLKHHGIARESKFNNNGHPNLYALVNATSKAQRNAKKGLLPMAEVRDAIRNAGKTPMEAHDGR